MINSEDQVIRSRGQSEVLGLVLLFALVLTMSLTVVVVGTDALDDARSTTETEAAEMTMAEFQSTANEMTVGGDNPSARQRLSFVESQSGNVGVLGSANVPDANTGSVSLDEDAGEITVIREPAGNVVLQENLGVLTYQQDSERIAYQGGGVFRKHTDSDTSIVESPPSFNYQYRDGIPTISFPITTIEGEVTGTEVALEETTPTISPDIENPIQPGERITIRIESEYAEAWGEVFEQRTGLTASYPASDTVEITFAGPPAEDPEITGALGAIPDGVFMLSHRVYLENYHSVPGESSSDDTTTYIRGSFDGSNGGQAGHGNVDGNLEVQNDFYLTATAGGGNSFSVTNGDTIVGGDFEVEGRAEFDGDIHVGEDVVDMTGQGSDPVEVDGDLVVGGNVQNWDQVEVTGDLHVMGNLEADASEATIDGDVYVGGNVEGSGWSSAQNDPDAPQATDFPPNDPVSQEINDRSSWSTDEDAPSKGTISDIENSGGCTPCVLHEGEYALDRITLESSETLEFDTTGGPIELYVEGTTMVQDGTIEITSPDHSAHVFANSEFQWNQGQVLTPYAEPHAPSFWVYMHPDMNGRIQDEGFVGVIYAPGDDDSGEIVVDYNMNGNDPVYGAVIGNIDFLNQQSEIRFDEALMDYDGGDDGSISDGDRVSWLQVSTTTVEVSDAD